MSSDGNKSKASSSKRGSGSSNAGSDEEGDAEEDSSSSSSVQDNLNGTLSSFRIKWKQELDSLSNSTRGVSLGSPDREGNPKRKSADKPKQLSTEMKAKLLFHQGIEFEQSGKYYDAIQCYKNAMQLDPDIEFKIYSESKQNRPKNEANEEVPEDGYPHEHEGGDSGEEVGEEEDEYDGSEELFSRFQRLLSRNETLILPARAPSITHLSAIPMEIIIYILRFVMSQHHDARSLEMCSLVCRGLYICARDSAIWRAACIRTWGLECQKSLGSPYGSWRSMYLERPRLETLGCYISKTSYIRHGDNSFQDRTHRPWHVVTYYRYLRFFPGGLVLLLTTADPPASVVASLKWRTPKDSNILSGHYKLREDRVFVVAKQSRFNLNNSRVKSQRKRVNDYEPRDQTYHLELKIEPHRHKQNMQLQWQNYSIALTNYLGATNTNYFNMLETKFPPYRFSRVKSFTSESDGILEVNY